MKNTGSAAADVDCSATCNTRRRSACHLAGGAGGCQQDGERDSGSSDRAGGPVSAVTSILGCARAHLGVDVERAPLVQTEAFVAADSWLPDTSAVPENTPLAVHCGSGEQSDPVSQNWQIWVGNNIPWILFFHSFPLISL